MLVVVELSPLTEGMSTMSTVVRPAPPRPSAPSAPVASRPVAPINGGTLPAPAAVAVAPVAVAPVASVAPVAEKSKKGRVALPTWSSLFATQLNAAGEHEYVMVAAADGTSEHKQVKLESVPVCGTADGEYDHKKFGPLKLANFKKEGDFYRFQSALSIVKSDEYLMLAKDADAGKTRSSKFATMAAEYANILAGLKPLLSAEQFAEIEAKYLAISGGVAVPVA